MVFEKETCRDSSCMLKVPVCDYINILIFLCCFWKWLEDIHGDKVKRLSGGEELKMSFNFKPASVSRPANAAGDRVI